MSKTNHKRSVFVSGRNSSVSLEDEFWNDVVAIAAARGVSTTALISEIDRQKGGAANLSSAIRIFVLQHYYKGKGAT